MIRATSNPEGWQHPWTFTDEIELWKIPKGEQAAALEWELWREQSRAAGLEVEKPWLQISEKERIRKVSRLNRRSGALFAMEPGHIKEVLKGENLRPWPKAEKYDSKMGEYAPTVYHYDSLELSVTGKANIHLAYAGERKVVALSIDPRARKEDIRREFEKLLSELIIGKSGRKKDSDTSANLQGLAVLRAYNFKSKGMGYMRYFSGTPYAGREPDQKTRLREIRKKIKGA